ncbi:GNAT family N-acetyltransferase [Celerinatantimonas diazotrophica]|uniref:Phosphinothricin acetyltransferase n=1 Tax=Celerinatantimonas diazotrophica TaxID=412034 RepID=A0A4R1KGE0_9GAMM|nr:GNAT family N-acetyltransferase [Celerinatantimonas diazotrophica]TCK63190.1 phosphinothricin acetyltransferase [Celerinatantimonas diazotrophica]CAG9295559.1 Putative phosphinothricin acetyltransferase YwnH [Celerinatantimonas diazotrophica]
MVEYQLRNATPADLEAIVAIYNTTIASRQVTADMEPISVADRNGWLEEHQRIGHPIQVAISQNKVIAWFSFSTFYDRPAYQQTREISIYLAEQVRGHGLGKKLLADAEKLAKEQNINVLIGFIFSHNTPSMKLFEHHGYQLWGELPKVAKLDHTLYNLSILGKRLD